LQRVFRKGKEGKKKSDFETFEGKRKQELRGYPFRRRGKSLGIDTQPVG